MHITMSKKPKHSGTKGRKRTKEGEEKREKDRNTVTLIYLSLMLTWLAIANWSLCRALVHLSIFISMELTVPYTKLSLIHGY